MEENKSRKWLYDTLTAKGHNVGKDYAEFDGLMSSNQESRKWAFEEARNLGYNVGKDFDEFESLINPVQTQLAPTDGELQQQGEQQQQTEKEYVEGFGEGFKQGWQGLVSGSKYFAGEIANAFSGSSMDDKNALGRWDELQKKGVDIAAETDMKKWGEDAMVNDGGTLRALTQQEKRDYETIQEAIKDAGGDLDKARKLMEQRAKETTWGDSLRQEAAEEMNQMKPTKGFGAWVGNLAPQMIPSAAALALAYFTKNPKWAKMVGNIGMAGMTASTAGSTMKEARDAGASDMQVWGAGVADGTIEYLTEKLPFDKLTNRIFGNTKKKLSREIADGLAENPQTREEMERLLGEAANSVGLNWKQVGKSVLAQTTAEGLSEAAAGTLQTATQMIYQEPENYPTLHDYVTNAWEGAKAGMFMGAVLGAPVPLAQKVQNDKRRKQQGEVYVAGYINDNGETEVVEVVGSSKDGNLVVFGQGGYNEISPEDVTYAHTFSYQEFKTGELQQEFDNGYELETPQEMTDAKNMYDMQRQRVADALGEDVLADIDNDPEAAIGKLGEDEPTNRTVIEYLNAKMVYDGMNKRVADDADARMAESDALVDSHTHKKTGMVQGATMKDEDRRVYIVNGNVVHLQDGTGIDLDASDNSIIISDAESGELEQVSPEVLLNVDAEIDPTAEKQAARDAIASEVRANAERMQNGVVGFAPGDVYTVLGEDGNTHQVEIVQDNGDHTVAANVDGEPVNVMTKEQIQNEVDAYNKQRVVLVAESAQGAEDAEAAKPNYELNAHVTLQTPEGVVTGNINQAENDDNLIEVQVNKPFGGKKTVDMYTREELDNMVVEVADENGNVIWSKPAENAEAAADVQGTENTNTPQEGGAENVNTAPAAPIVRGKQDQIDAAESIKAGTTPQQMADAYMQEYGDEEGLPLSTAQEKLAQVQEERQKTKDVDLKNGPLRKQEKFWSEVVDLLTPKEETVAEEGRQETVGTPVALQYLLEGGKGSIENAGYFFYAIQAAFPHIGAQLQEIRNSMPTEMLGMTPDAFVASNPSQLQEVRRLVEATYGEAGTRILDQMLANSTGFYPREGKALDLEIENLRPVEGNEQAQEVTEKDSLLKKVKDWLSPENISWAEGKSLSESVEMFGNEVEPIAIIPPVLKKYFPELSNLYLYSGKAYLIDHAANHHPELSVEEYENIQKTLDEYDDIKDLSSNGVKKLAFIKMMEKGYAVVTELSEKDGKIMLHKTFFYKGVNGKRVPYKNKPSLFDKTSVDGSTTISPAEETTAGRHRNISALDVSADKGTDKSVTAEGTQEEISENAQNATQSEQNESANEQNELEKAEKERIDALVPTIEDMTDGMQTADEFVAGLFGNGIRITPESFRKETGLGWEEQRRLVGIIAGKEKGGLTVEQAAETIVENYRAELDERGFSGDSMEMRDMVIDILSSGNPRAYAKKAAARRAEQALHREMEAFDRYTQEVFHMSAEENIMYEESMLPKYIEPYKDFDEQEYYSNFADEQSTQNKHDTTRESAETGGSREILSEEQPSATPGEGAAGEGQQGGTLQGDVQGDAQEGLARAEAGQEVAEQPTEKESRTRFSTSMFEDAERIAREEQRRAPLRSKARAWEKILGVKVTLMERLEDVKNPVARREIEAAEKKGKKVPGWYSDTEGVFLYLPHVENEKEVDKTCVHEIVSHKGLKELLGQEKFDELCRKVWGIMSPAARKEYRNYPNVHNEIEAADEYIAHLSEEVELTARERSVWQKIMDFIAGLLGRKADNRSKAASIVGKETLSRKDIAELVRLSYAEYLQRNGNAEAVKEAVELGEAGEGQTMLREVDDPDVIAKLEASPKRRGFRNVVRNEDGTFSSPMAYWLQSTTGGAKTRVETAKFELGKWEEAEEHPELVDENGKIVLVKPDKGTVPVAYDPYIHNRLDPVNLQFKDAWKRNDLIYVETEVPTTDLESGYHADKALLPVGVHSWSNGDLMLSIYDKPIRFVPWDEVADAWAERLAGKDVHFDVVPPLMRSLLVERGVDIVAPHKGMGKDCRDAYAKWKESVDGNNVVRFRTLPNERLRKLDEGETCNIERVFTQQKMFNFSSGEKIESYEDVAYIFRSLEDEAVENAFVALVKNGKPTIVHLGMGTATQSTVDQQAVIVAVERIKPDAVYLVHNHPSGNLKASRQDAMLLDSMKKAYGDIVKDGIIINLRSGKYSVFNEEGSKIEEASPNTPEKDIPVKTYSFSKRVFDKDFNVEELMHVTGSDAADAYAREHGLVAALTSSQRLGERGKLSLLVISQGSKIVGNVFLNHTEVLPSNLGNISKEIAYYVSAMGGQAGILYGRFGINETRHLGGAVNRASAGSVRMLDAISMTDYGGYVSALDEGVMEETPSYGKGETRFRTVYHGSAADFNKFDRNFSGSGEGQAVMGAGHYVTTSEGTGRYYAEVASEMRRKVVQEGGYTYNGKVVRSRPLVDAYEALKKNEFDVDKAIESIEHRIAVIRRVKGDKANTTNAEEAIRFLNEEKANKGILGYQEEIVEKPARHLYEVEIPDDNGKNYFDLDKKATKKTKDEAKTRLLNALDNGEEGSYWKKNRDIIEDEWRYNVNNPDATNDSVRATMEQFLTQEEVADILSDMGYVGSKSKATDGTTYIIYKDDNIEIKSNTRFRFIGEQGASNLDKAEEATTRLDNLAVAREMEASDKDAKAIKMATGWERGADGKWRYEVDDALEFDLSANVDYRKRHPELARYEELRDKYAANLMEMGDALTEDEQQEYDRLENEYGGYGEYHNSRKLKDYVDAPELFAAYPELRNVEFAFAEMDEDTYGKYLPESKKILINERRRLASKDVIKRYLVHEIQHAIQHIEGFELGANKDMQNPNKLAQKQQNIEFMQNQLNKHVSERNELLEQKDELNAKMSDWYNSHEDATAEDVANDKDMSEWNRLYDELESKIEDADRKVSWDKKWLDTINKANTQLGIEGYAKVSGEVEARNVMSRLGMTLEQRRNSLASETEDVAREDQIFLKGSLEGQTMFRVTDDIEDANARFNEELQQQIDGTLPSGHVYQLGMPSDVLRSTGVPMLPIMLQSSVLARKANDKNHPFELSDVKNLVRLIQKPIAIFEYGDKSKAQNLMIGLSQADSEGKQFLVGLSLNPIINGRVLEINSVRNVFPKNYHDWIHWINQGKMLRVDNKEEIQNIINALRINPVDYIDDNALDSAAKVIKDFQNPSVGGGIRFRSVDKLRDRYDKMVRLPNKIGSVKWYENLPYRLREAYQDSMLSLKVLQEVILEETGNTMTSGENAYMAENQMSSKNKAEAEMYERDFFKPMMEEVKNLLAAGATYDEVQKYLFAKHGLERNMEMYKKNKQESIDEWIEERTKQLVDGGMAQADARAQAQQDIALYPSMSDSELDKQYRRDYSGLTALTEKDSVADAEAEATQMVADFEGRFSTADLWGKINAATRETLRKSYDSGMMDKATYNKILGMYHYYIPLRGWDADVAENEYEYLSDRGMNLSPVLVKTKGRTSLADDPIATIGFMAEGAIVQGNRNLMKQRFMNFVLNNPTSLVSVSKQWYVKQADGTWRPDNPQIPADATGDQVAAIVEQHEQKMLSLGKDATTRRAGLKLDLHATNQEKQEHMVRVKRGGKEYCLYINGSPRAAQALNGMTNPDASNSSLYKASSAVKNFMARMFTSQNPAFVVSNLSRDLIWAGTAVAVKENKDYAARYTKNVGKAFKNATLPRLLRKYQNGTLDMNVEEERLFMEFIKHGGETGFTQITSVEDYKKDIKRFVKEVQKGKSIGKKVWDGFFDGVEFLNRSAEDTTRFMVYMTSRQMGRDVATSVSDAKEITVNFNKKGSGGLGASVMNFCYIFFNAAIQSLSGFGKMMAEHPKRTLAGLTAYASAGVIVPAMSIALQALTGDDDDESYWDLPEWIRRNNLVLYVPFTDSGFITIPLPHELRPFYAMGEIALSAMCGREDVEDGLRKAALNFAEMLPLDFTGNGGNLAVNLTPTVAQPVAQIIANKDYTGKPIYKDYEWNKRDPEWTKAYKGTSPWIVEGTKWLNRLSGGDDVKSGAVDLNPALIEHVLESYTGGAGKTFNRTMKTFQMMWDEDMRQWRNVPVISSFVQSGDERIQGSDVNNRYYEAKDEFEDTKHLLSGYKKQKKEHKPGTAGYVEYARKLDELMNSDEYKRYKVFKGRQKAIKKVSDKLKETDDRNRIDTLNTRLMQLKEEMLEELEKADDSPKP